MTWSTVESVSTNQERLSCGKEGRFVLRLKTVGRNYRDTQSGLIQDYSDQQNCPQMECTTSRGRVQALVVRLFG